LPITAGDGKARGSRPPNADGAEDQVKDRACHPMLVAKLEALGRVGLEKRWPLVAGPQKMWPQGEA